MRYTTLLSLPLAATFLFPFPANGANNIEADKENYSAAKKTVLIDGNLSDWGGATIWKDVKFSIPKGAPKQLVSFETLSGATTIATDSVWTGPEDHSTAWAITWDEANLYIGMVVTDDYHQNSNSGWNGDSLQIAFATGERTGAPSHLYNYGLGGTDEALGEIVINEEKGPGGAQAAIVRNTAAKKTIYEFRFPASSLEVAKFEAGMKIGVGLCANDGDLETPGQKGWSGWGVHSIVHGKTGAQTGLVTLAPGDPPVTKAPPLEFNAEPANYITADGNMADWVGKEFRGPVPFEIPKTGGGKLVYFETLSGTSSVATDSVWDGAQDQTTRFSFAWDANNFYVGVIVTDDYHQNSNSGWNGDALQLLFANSARDTVTHLYNFGLDGTDGALGNVVINNEKGPGGEIAGIVRNAARKTTTYEIKFPASALGLSKFEAKMKIGIGLCVNDGDEQTPGQKGWSGWGVHSIVHGKSADRAGLVTLVAAKAQPALTFDAPPVTQGFNVVDGDLSDWANRPFIGPVPFEIPKATGGKVVLFETLSGAATVATDSVWSGPEDHTSVVSMAWEKDALHIGVVVTDDYHQNSNSGWNGDSLQIAFATGERTGAPSHLYNYGLNGEEGATAEIVVSNEKGPGGADVAISRTGVTTTYELKFPASALELTEFKEGMKLGIGLCINDGDKDTPGQRGWSGFGVHSIVHGKNAEKTGLVTLTAGGTVALAQVNIPATLSVNAPLTTAGGNLKGEYWRRPVNSIPTDGATSSTNRIDNQINGFGTPNGTFTATSFHYRGNDLTLIDTWLGADAKSFVGSVNNLDDGAIRLSGFINITNASTVRLGTTSDDGSRITIGGIDVINNDSGHGDATVDTNVVFSAAGLYPIEITFFNGDWTSDGTGANLNHSGSRNPSVHGGANFHLRVAGTNVTPAVASRLFYSAAPVVYVPGRLAASPPLTSAGGTLNGEYWKRPPVSIPTDGAANPANRIDNLINGFGPPDGTFRASRFVYRGNDLTHVTNWLGADASSFVGKTNNLDDGAFRFRGYINVTNAGRINLGTTSDDGSRITIAGIDVINNDGSHGDVTRDTNVVFSAAGLYPIEITFFNGDWTSDGTGAKLNHSGSTDPAVHGGANLHLRVAGADVTTASAARLLYPAAPVVYVPGNLAVAPPQTRGGGRLQGEYWKRRPWSIPTDGATNPTNRIDRQIRSFGPPTGTFQASKLVYRGNDLTHVTNWLGADASSFVGSTAATNDLDDGAFRFSGYINVAAPGKVNLGTTSDDGSRITIAGIDVINNDSGHGDATVDTNVVFTAAGLYPIEITFFNGDWTSDGTGANLNHSGSKDPSVHGGANFHLRVSGADVTTNRVAMFFPTAPAVTGVSTIPNGLVSYWNFDGHLLDSVKSAHGTPRGTTLLTYEDGKTGFGKSIKLTGTNFVEITGSSNSLRFANSSLSIAGWFRVDTFDKQWQALIAKGEGTNYRIARRGAGNNIAYAGGVGEGVDDVPAITNGWHHFVAVTDASGAKFGTALYVDGVIRSVNTAKAVLAAGTSNLYIGENPGALNRQWKGGIDDVALWNRVLTQDEVSALYNGGTGTPISTIPGVTTPPPLTPPVVAKIDILGVGASALLGSPLTDPDGNGLDALGGAKSPTWDWAGITSSHEPDFEGGENAFNIFDHKVGGGNDKWCCDDPIPGKPVWVAVQFRGPTSLTHFTIASGNDTPGRDPTDWAIQGSNDGITYSDIYVGTLTPWTARNQVVKFTLPAASKPYYFIRYIAYDTPANLHQINEIEYFGTVAAAVLPAEFGQAVNGFQDDFTGATRDPDWKAFGPAGDRYEQAAGILYVSTSIGDPNHLLYTKPGYSNDVHEVLARIRVAAFQDNHDYPRGGIAAGVGTNSQGLNLHFRSSTQDNVPGRQFKFLDDLRAWGPAGLRTNVPPQTTPGWSNNTWYWLRMRLDPMADKTNSLFGKVWVADGVTPEPANWQLTWRDSAIPKPLRRGFAGITGSSVDGSGNGLGHLEVDYVLIKAAGLPQIKVAFAPTGPALTVPMFTGIGRLPNNRLQIGWVGAGTLEQADSVTGPWTTVPAASAVGIITPSGVARFYRLRP